MSLSNVVPDLGPRYIVEGLLGRGRMGAVYLALDLSLDCTVAVKVIHSGYFSAAHLEAEVKAVQASLARFVAHS